MDATQALSNAQALYQKLANRRTSIDVLDLAYQGEQPLKFASNEFSDFHANRYEQFSDNWVAVVADALNERIRVEGVQIPGLEEYPGPAKQLWEFWQRNSFEAQSSQGFLESIIAARSYVIVWGDKNGSPYATWEHPSQVYLRTSPADDARKIDAIKTWVDVDENTEYLYYYTKDALWKYQRGYYGVDKGRTASGLDLHGTTVEAGYAFDSWIPFEDPEDDVWPLPNPMGVLPVVEFPNRPLLRTGPISDVAGAKDMQDAINLFWAYLFGAADHASMPARVVMGQKPPKIPLLDSNGNKIGEQEVPLTKLQKNRILWLTGENARIGEWSRADLEAFTKVIEVAVGHLGGQSRTPAHYFVANKGLSNINGETLIATETPLVKKAEEFALYSQRPMRELWELLALAAGDVPLAHQARNAKTMFANAAIRSDAQRSDAMAKDRTSGYPFEWLLHKYGESPENIEAIMQMRAREQSDPQFQDLVDRVNEDVGL